MTRKRFVVLATALVLVASGVVVWLSLTRPEQAEAAALGPSSRDGEYVPAALAGPAGPAVAAAVRTVPLAFSHDHRDLAASLEDAVAGMTPAFADTYTATFDRAVRPAVRRQRTVTDGVVRGAGVVRVAEGGKRALVLVYVDQLLVGSRGQRPGRPARVLSTNQVLAQMVLRGGAWRVGGIRPL